MSDYQYEKMNEMKQILENLQMPTKLKNEAGLARIPEKPFGMIRWAAL